MKSIDSILRNTPKFDAGEILNIISSKNPYIELIDSVLLEDFGGDMGQIYAKAILDYVSGLDSKSQFVFSFDSAQAFVDSRIKVLFTN